MELRGQPKSDRKQLVIPSSPCHSGTTGCLHCLKLQHTPTLHSPVGNIGREHSPAMASGRCVVVGEGGNRSLHSRPPPHCLGLYSYITLLSALRSTVGDVTPERTLASTPEPFSQTHPHRPVTTYETSPTHHLPSQHTTTRSLRAVLTNDRKQRTRPCTIPHHRHQHTPLLLPPDDGALPRRRPRHPLHQLPPRTSDRAACAGTQPLVSFPRSSPTRR